MRLVRLFAKAIPHLIVAVLLAATTVTTGVATYKLAAAQTPPNESVAPRAPGIPKQVFLRVTTPPRRPASTSTPLPTLPPNFGDDD